MKLSVLMITYNHERYIRQALDSVLMQDVDFDFEIVVGEDCSSDSTRAILVEYSQKHPDKIRLLLRDRNMGAVPNFYDTLSQCRGQYVALLEGDDYWSGTQKLKKQVAFLDEHPDYASCFHNVIGHYEDGRKPDYSYVRADHKETLELEDLLVVNLIPTCSCVFRRGLIDPIPSWAFGLKMADYPLHILNAQFGKTAYLDEVMGVYRVHAGGVWTGMDQMTQLLVDLKLFQNLASGLLPQYRGLARRALAVRQWSLADAYEKSGDRGRARHFALQSLLNDPLAARPKFRGKLKMLARLTTPSLYGMVGKARRALPTTDLLPPRRTAVVNSPRVSVIIPAYNAERYLLEAVSSTLCQSYDDFECLIVDDGSIDRTPALLEELAQRDARIKPIRIPHGGIVEALNAGLCEARGDLIARMDADDICMPDRFQKQIQYLDAHPECVAVGSGVILVDPFNAEIQQVSVSEDHGRIDADLLRGHGTAIFHPAAMIRKSALLAVGGYRPEFQWSEDIDVFLRLAEKGKLANLPEPLVRIRQHFSSVSKNKIDLQRRRRTRLLGEAYRRRGLAAPAEINVNSQNHLSRYEQLLEWGRNAVATRNLAAARRHAYAAVRSKPLKLDSWGLAYHALAGR